ncbi:RNA polymerase sigma factor [Alteromonadaceae bacterium M269]|nr:RNA polymerase sigma factor [Alteromonadaceae bacterium M269]
MTNKNTTQKTKSLSGISGVFWEQNTFLKRFLAKFLNREQDIEDVAQEAYLKAYSAEQDKGEIEQPKAFLFSIAKNLALNELTRKSNKITSYIEECQEGIVTQLDVGSDKVVEGHESLGVYCEAVAALPEKCRKVYLLRKVHGLPHKEIAERLGISLSMVEKHLRIGVLSCQEYINRYHSDGSMTGAKKNTPSIIGGGAK